MAGNSPDQYKVSLFCRACGKTLEKVLRNMDTLPSCPKCRSEMLVENVTKEIHND